MMSKLPKLLSAARRASPGGIPLSTFASASISTWRRISSSMSRMTASRPRSARRRAERRLNNLISRIRPLRSLPHLGDGEDEPVPARLLLLELAPARLRERVELGAAARLVHLPLRGDPALLLDAVERRVDRSLLDFEHLARHLPDALDDAVAVQRA